MRLFFLFILICVLSCQSKKPSESKLAAFVNNADPSLKKTIATLKLVETQPLPPQCGIMAFALAQKFDVVSDSNSLAASQIIAVTPCPEFYGKGFFKKGHLYQVVLTAQNMDTIAYGVISNYKGSKLPTYWVEKLEKSH